MPNGRVFVIQKSKRFDLGPAEEFGPVEEVLDENVFISPFNVDDFMQAIENRIDDLDFDPGVDWVAVTGSNLYVTLFVTKMSSMYPEISLLMFDAARGGYNQRQLAL